MRLGHKKKSPGSILIDLTPLLDVVFIFLIVVLCYQDNFNSEADEKLVQAEEMMHEAESRELEAQSIISDVETQLSTYKNIDEFVTIVTVGASFDAENRKHRTIRIFLNENVSEAKEFALNPSNENNVWEECKNEINEIVDGSVGKPVILRFSTDKMLYRDENKLGNIFKELSEEKDVYVSYTNGTNGEN